MRPNEGTVTAGKGVTRMVVSFRVDGDFDEKGCLREITWLRPEPGYWGRVGGETDEEGRRSHFLFDDPFLSRRHFLLERDECGWALQPASATNSTFVNGAEVKAPVRLENKSVIQVGNALIVWRQEWLPEKPAFSVLLAGGGTKLPVPPEAVPSVTLALASTANATAFEELRREVGLLGKLACVSWPNGMQSLNDFVKDACCAKSGGVVAEMERLLGDRPFGVKESDAPRLVFNLDAMKVSFGGTQINLTPSEFVWYTALALHRRDHPDDGCLGLENLDNLVGTAKRCLERWGRGLPRRKLPNWIAKPSKKEPFGWEVDSFRTLRAKVRTKVKVACESAGLDSTYVVPETRRAQGQMINLPPNRIEISLGCSATNRP